MRVKMLQIAEMIIAKLSRITSMAVTKLLLLVGKIFSF